MGRWYLPLAVKPSRFTMGGSVSGDVAVREFAGFSSARKNQYLLKVVVAFLVSSYNCTGLAGSPNKNRHLFTADVCYEGVAPLQ